MCNFVRFDKLIQFDKLTKISRHSIWKSKTIQGVFKEGGCSNPNLRVCMRK